MARKKKAVEPLPTIWRVDDELWAKAEQVLAEFDPPARFGPDRIDQRKALDGVIYRMRSGACSGTNSPASSATTARSTARSSGGSSGA
jgi:hypothetical protein